MPRTNPGAPTTGTSTSRTDYTPGQTIEDWLTQQIQKDPNYPLPRGYRVGGDGRVMRDTHSPLEDFVTKGLPAIGFGIAGGAGIAGAMGAGGSAGAAGAGSGAFGGTGAGAASTLAPTVAGGGATTAAGAGAGGGVLDKIFKYGSQAANIGKDLAPIFGGMADDRAKAYDNAERNQVLRDNIDLSAANLENRSILDRAGVDMDQREFQVEAPAARMDNSVRGSMIANAQPIKVGQGPSMTLSSGRSIKPIHFGGYDASLLNDNTRELGDLVTGQMLEQQLAGDKFDPLPEVEFPRSTPPPASSGVDKAIGAAATGSSILGGIGSVLDRIMKNRRPAIGSSVDPASVLGPDGKPVVQVPTPHPVENHGVRF